MKEGVGWVSPKHPKHPKALAGLDWSPLNGHSSLFAWHICAKAESTSTSLTQQSGKELNCLLFFECFEIVYFSHYNKCTFVASVFIVMQAVTR